MSAVAFLVLFFEAVMGWIVLWRDDRNYLINGYIRCVVNYLMLFLLLNKCCIVIEY